jgi:ribonuclease/clavin/mitogillin
MASAIRESAAVVLTRGSGDDLEVFLARRSLNMRFMPGQWAFPGGAVDEEDRLHPTKGAQQVAAARELLEETGLDIRGKTFTDFGRWKTPPFSPIRFEAQYFHVAIDHDQNVHAITDEHCDTGWFRPADAILRRNAQELILSFPIQVTLQALVDAQGNTAAAATLLKSIPFPHEVSAPQPYVRIIPLLTDTLPPATHTNCYILGDDEVVVLDPAGSTPEESARLIRLLSPFTVKEIWLTHHHKDHIGATNALRDATGAPVAAHAITASLLQGQIRVDRLIPDGEETQMVNGRQSWTAYHTPGHAAGHLVFFESQTKALISGDNVVGLGSVLIDPDEGDMTQYLNSLDQMLSLQANVLYPAHGPYNYDPAQLIGKTRQHRIDRENAILAALDEPVTIAQIVSKVYTDVPIFLHQLAGRSVQAHLIRLVTQKRVSQREQSTTTYMRTP